MSEEKKDLSRRKLIAGLIGGGVIVVGGGAVAGAVVGGNKTPEGVSPVTTPSETPIPTEIINEIDIDPTQGVKPTKSQEPAEPDYGDVDETYLNDIDSEKKLSDEEIKKETEEIENLEIPDDVIIKAPGE